MADSKRCQFIHKKYKAQTKQYEELPVRLVHSFAVLIFSIVIRTISSTLRAHNEWNYHSKPDPREYYLRFSTILCSLFLLLSISCTSDAAESDCALECGIAYNICETFCSYTDVFCRSLCTAEKNGCLENCPTPPVLPPSTPGVPSASNGTYASKVRVTWSHVSGTTSYKVYRCTSSATSSCGSGYTDSASPYDDTQASPGVTYYYRVKACNSAGCSEHSSQNSGYRAVSDSADLVISAFSSSLSTVIPGESFQLNATTTNQGSGTSSATTLRYYISSDSTISTSDTEFTSFADDIGILAPGASESDSIRTFFRESASPGPRYFGVCVDSVTGESDSGNNCSNAVTITVTMPPSTYSLTVSTSGIGTVTSDPPGIDCGTDCSEIYSSGTSVTLTATPSSGYQFSGWGGACSGSTALCTVTMSTDLGVSATFEETVQHTQSSEFWVISSGTDQILRYEATTGNFLSAISSPNLLSPSGITQGLDGNVYVGSSAGSTGLVLRYEFDKAKMVVFASTEEFDKPHDLLFGPNGHLYVSEWRTDEVLRFNGTTGAFLGIFTSGASMRSPSDIAFGPDGNLLVLNNSDNVLRFSGATGVYMDIFATHEDIDKSGVVPSGLAFGPDNNLYVASEVVDQVFRFNGVTGAFMDIFTKGDRIDILNTIVFGPNGSLYVGDWGSDAVIRFNGTAGAFINTFINSRSGGLERPSQMAFVVVPADTDGDGKLDPADNCPEEANPDQKDTDNDNEGDVCDLDDDGDGMTDSKEVAMGRDPLVNEPAVIQAIFNDLLND